MDQPGIAVIGKYHRFVARENRIEVPVGQAVRVFFAVQWPGNTLTSAPAAHHSQLWEAPMP